MSKTLVIGGNGFIGQHLLKELTDANHEIISLGRNKHDISGVTSIAVSSLFDSKLKWIMQDGVEEIFYLAYATTPKTSFDDPVRDIEENLSQAVHLFELASKLPALRKLVYVSSGGTVYGNTEELLIKESHVNRPISPYGITKLTIEHFAYLFYNIYNLPVVIVRPANAYGIGQVAKAGQGFIAYAMQSIMQQKPITIYGESGTIRDYIYVSDVAKALTAVLAKGSSGAIYNIGSGRGTSNMELVTILKNMVASQGYTAQVNIRESRPFDVNRNVLDCGALRSDCGWQPFISLEEGLSIMWEWFKDHDHH
jgi:UDP-glucose 4-epimerase